MGMATIAGRKTLMVNLVLPGTSSRYIGLRTICIFYLIALNTRSSARKFVTTDGRAFEWRKTARVPSGFRYEASVAILSVYCPARVLTECYSRLAIVRTEHCADCNFLALQSASDYGRWTLVRMSHLQVR